MRREELNEIKDKYKDLVKIRTEEDVPNGETHILVCGGTGCTSNSSKEIVSELKEKIKENKLENVRVIMTGCFGLCARGPIMIVRPGNIFYTHVTKADVDEIVKEHLIGGKPVERLLTHEADGELVHKLDELNFYKKQERIVLKNCGRIDPENINEYIAFDGYQALAKVLFDMKPEEVIDVIKDSGLRGRGGAGFPTGKKWEMGFLSKAKEKYVACNADEGDPGAFMDRSILEGNPHGILEAMTILARTIGAQKGYIYVRHEYPIAVERLQIAIDQAHEKGLLGKNILESGFDFDIELKLGAGAFVCGEETALMTSIEGNRGEPRPRPPFPTDKGLFQKPTVLNNVETYANICPIILNGADWFKKIGIPTSTGTKVFALGGNINNTGLIEVPMGTTLKEIIYDIGGGIPNGREFKAAQTGGPSGGCIPKDKINLPMDYESLLSIGAMMGSGGLVVMDDSNCMVDIAKFFLDFTVDESCGKCTSCRIGTKRMNEMLEDISMGRATLDELNELEELGNYIKDTSLCGLGQSAPNPVLSTIKNFREEYEKHITEHNCEAKVCKGLVTYKIMPDKCIGCDLCKRNCPANAITGNIKEPHIIDKDKCLKCGLCMSNCRFKAIVKE